MNMRLSMPRRRTASGRRSSWVNTITWRVRAVSSSARARPSTRAGSMDCTGSSITTNRNGLSGRVARGRNRLRPWSGFGFARHSACAASRLAALLLPYICAICSVVAPCHSGASPPSVLERIRIRTTRECSSPWLIRRKAVRLTSGLWLGFSADGYAMT